MPITTREKSIPLAEHISQRGEKMIKQVTQNKVQQNSILWTILGFSVGLVAAAALVYLFIRNRLQENTVESQSFQLSQNGYTNRATNGQVLPADAVRTATPQAPITQQAQAIQPTVTLAKQQTATPAPPASHPADARFLGVASTKRYYPVETPLDQIDALKQEPVDVLYFASEGEAKAQGFSAAM